MPFGIVGRTGPGMRQVVGFGHSSYVCCGLAIGPREGVFLGVHLERAIVTKGAFRAYVCYSAATRPSSRITLGDLLTFMSDHAVQLLRQMTRRPATSRRAVCRLL